MAFTDRVAVVFSLERIKSFFTGLWSNITGAISSGINNVVSFSVTSLARSSARSPV
ncbi:hypothetical protein [Arthrobacter woluwensis]|uniref:TMP repeat-containing protein n=1 Tax=Arthrobacter woluwensis TaxID=156980 RepID=A0A1H4X2F0_9MICC|nr:hypothetical protein [Arthrobacter woluwensis]SEC98914.1 TMP repeat-containing protein [Arthrobacter woluwensis]